MILGMETVIDMLRDGLMILRGCMVNMELAKEMLKEEDRTSFAMVRSCVLLTHGFKRRSRIKQRTV